MTLPAEVTAARSLDSPDREASSPAGRPSRPLQLSPASSKPMRNPVPPDRTSDGDADDVELMMRVGWEDAEAFGQIMQRHWEPTFRYARHLQQDSDRAYDVAQEAFARLWEKRREWEPSGSVRGWLFRTAHNLVIAERRKWKVRVRWGSIASTESESESRSPLRDAESSELRLAIQRAVQGLTPRRREVFTLFHLHHLSYREIGELLNIRPQTIANHLQAAVAELRAVLRPFVSTAQAREQAPQSSPDERS